tara:strand:- start:19435 stop:20982 length:1548 start_codon:yes stop_codon:yes gene_type:complete
MSNKNFVNFLNINKKLVFEGKKFKIIIFDRQRIIPSILGSIFSIALAQKNKSDILVVTNNQNTNFVKIYKSFGITKFHSKFFNNIEIIASSILEIFFGIIQIKKRGFGWFIRNFKLNNILFGDLIYDSYIRFDKSYLNPRIDFKFVKIFFIATVKSKKIYKLLTEIKPKFIISNGGGYATLGGISCRIANKLNIKTITPYFDKKKNISFINSKDPKCMVFPNGDIKRISKKNLNKKLSKFSKKKIEKYIVDRTNARVITNTTNILDLQKINKNNYYFSKKDIIKKLFKNKKISKLILVCPHAFADCPHMVGDIFFRDYYNQVYETLNYINNLNNKNIGWIVRPHPGSKRYGESGLVEDVINKLKNDFIKLSLKTFTAANLSKVCDNVITCTGTVGLEFATNGKLSVNAGKSYYAGLGFSKDHSNKKQFFNSLKHIAKIKKLNNRQIFMAKKALFYFEYFDKGVQLDKSMIIDNIVINEAAKSTNKETFFCKKLISNLTKFNFENDSMFKSIKNLI